MSPCRRDPRVLLVDDHPMVRAGIRTALRRHFRDARFEEAGCAADALALLASQRPHIVLLDVNLPGTNGLDLARQINDGARKPRVLMVAGETDPWTVDQALKAGASGFLAKTSAPAMLVQAVAAVLGGTVFLCPDSQAALARARDTPSPALLHPGPAVLSDREREVLRCLASGENVKGIARLLGISPNTVQTHRQHLTRKLGARSVADLVRYAIRHGLARP